MAITQAVCTSFKQELLQGTHNFTASSGDTFKIALYTSSASLDATTTAFSTTNEVSDSGTYSSGGGTLTSVTPTTSGTTAICDFADISFTSATITARGALIYNSSDSNKADQDEFEVGLGTLNGDSSTLTRTTVISSSNSDSEVNFSSGTKDVFCTIPASKLVFEDASNDVTIGRNLTVTGDLTITGDDITMNTNTSGAALIGDGTNFNPVAISGDLTIATNGAASLAAAQTNITSLLATDIKIGEDNQTKIDFETADEIHFYAANAEQVFVSDGVFGPQTDSDVDLGTNSVRFKDAYVDSVTVTGDVSVGDDLTVEGGVIDVKNTGAQSVVRFYCESSNAHYAQIQAPAHSAFSGNTTLTLPATTDTIAGIAATQTLTNKSIDSDNNTITNIVNADIKSSAAIADSKLDTISTAGKVALTALEIDGGSDIGADLTTSDLIIVDDGAGGTNRKAALSRLTTYMAGQGFSTEDPTALAIALG